MGSKSKLLDSIWEVSKDFEFNSVLDLFSGSGVVGYMYKCHGKEVTSNDYMAMAATYAKALIENKDIVLSNRDVERILKQTDNDGFVERVFKDLYFTDDENNKFIQAVVQKYGADPARLACIYVVPEGDSNHVFEFNGKTDQNGKLIRNESTLKYVYTLNADCSVITRAGGVTGNDGLTAAQGLVIMQLTKKLILPEFEKELNG